MSHKVISVQTLQEKPCPGSKIRSKGRGRGKGHGKGKGPISPNPPWKKKKSR